MLTDGLTARQNDPTTAEQAADVEVVDVAQMLLAGVKVHPLAVPSRSIGRVSLMILTSRHPAGNLHELTSGGTQ